ncbi:hypothetical protein [Leifsonia sp. NPDC058248]|uniref:hypothetical protein n=1 Tax=Leifsonia sp. NPDC058248 TaxID=3346402 RepID=UPI0036D806A1
MTDKDPFHAETTVEPVTALDKKLLSQEKLADGTWKVTYELTASNLSPVADRYTLTDTLRFGDQISVISASVKAAAPGTPVGNPSWNGEQDTLVVRDAVIAPNQTHRYIVVVHADTPASVDGNVDSQCPVPSDTDHRGGFLNLADLTATNGASHDEACGSFDEEPPAPGRLASTGFDGGIVGGAAVALLMLGAALLARRRRTMRARG